MSQTAKEAGIRFPTAVTETLWGDYIEPSEEDQKRYFQSEQGRLWDVLWMFSISARKCNKSTMFFKVLFVVNEREKPARLKAVIGPGDDMSPVITIMLPDED